MAKEKIQDTGTQATAADAGTSVKDEEHPLAGFANFSVEGYDEGSSDTSGIDTETDTSKTKYTDEGVTNKSKETETGASTDEGAEKKSDEGDTSKTDTGFEFKVPGTEEAGSDDDSGKSAETDTGPQEEAKGDTQEGTQTSTETQEAGTEADWTWNTAGKEIGLEFEGDDFAHFKEAYGKKLEEIEAEARERAAEELKKDPNILYKDLDEDTRNLIELAKKGNIKAYLDPVNEIDKYLSYDDETLLKENLKAITDSKGERRYSDERIEEKITNWQENNQIADEADKVRDELYSTRSELAESIIEQQKAEEKAIEEAQTQKIIDQTKAYTDAVKAIDTFMGGKVNDDVKEYVTNLWMDGKVHKMFQDPKKVVEFVLYDTIGGQALNDNRKMSFSEGQRKAKGPLHNVPPVTGGGTSHSPKTAPPKEGDFSSWGNIREEMAAG